MLQSFTIEQLMQAGYTLAPLRCKFCGSLEVEYSSLSHDALCGTCGRWQIEDDDTYTDEQVEYIHTCGRSGNP